MTEENNSQNRLILLTDWSKYHRYPTIGGLRALVFNANKNGFNSVIRRINSRILIKEQAFFEWVEEINNFGHQVSNDK